MRHDAGPGYGDNVIPCIRMFLGFTEFAERKAFLAAVEEMLKSDDAKLRDYAVTLCLGFIVFRDTVPDPLPTKNND